MRAVDAYILSNQYTDDTANQFGGLKGANCQFGATETSDGHLNTYTWKNDNDETQTSSYVVKDGKDGEKGDPGDDYVLTTQDKADIASIVLGELPIAESQEV